MIKGIFIANHNYQDKSSGVTKKIDMQLKAFNHAGMSIDKCILFSDTVIDKAIRRLPFVPAYFDIEISKLCSNIIRQQYDFVYIRYSFSTRYFIDFIRKISKSGATIIIEFPTFPYDRNSDQLSWKLELAKDKHYRNKLFLYTDIGVDYSEYDRIFNIPCIKISNGISPDSYIIHKTNLFRQKKTERITFIGVALLAKWNGYDRLIKSISAYNKTHDCKLFFNIVGEGNEYSALKQMVSRTNTEQYVKFYGYLSGDDLYKVYDDSDIGVGSLSPSRKYKNHIMSSLKTKEYTAIGIPFIKGDQDKAFTPETADFYYDVPDNEEDLNMEKIVEWYTKLLENYGDDLSIHIHSYAERYLSWEKQLIPVFDYISNTVRGKLYE